MDKLIYRRQALKALFSLVSVGSVSGAYAKNILKSTDAEINEIISVTEFGAVGNGNQLHFVHVNHPGKEKISPATKKIYF